MKRLKKTLILALLVIGGGFAAPVFAQGNPLFDPIADVLQHPRCLNCHTVTDFPRQGDDRIRHIQLVVRGDDGFGAPTLQCGACHQEENVRNGQVPGAHNWHLAPLSMGWEGLNREELCEALKDPSLNGGRTVDDLLHHMSVDALVLWGFEPGDRTKPPLTHPEFVSALEVWAQAGAPCR